MGTYATAVAAAVRILNNNPRQGIMFWGAPGCGKSHAATIGVPEALGLAPLGQPDSPVRMFRPSTHDPVDITGLPAVTDGATTWNTPDFLQELNRLANTHGRALWVIDELNQSVPMMFNALNGLILDGVAGSFRLDKRVSIICTGNRQTDRAASNRMPSHTANRLWHYDIESDLKGWTRWALTNNIPMWVISYLAMKPNHLNVFDPDRRENATERTWELFSRAAGDDLPAEETLSLASGFVGEGIAAELAAFRRTMDEMPDPDACLLNPTGAPLPQTLDAKYAMAGAMAHRASKGNLDRVLAYVGRMEKQYEVLTLRSAYTRDPQVCASRAWIEWASKPENVKIMASI